MALECTGAGGGPLASSRSERRVPTEDRVTTSENPSEQIRIEHDHVVERKTSSCHAPDNCDPEAAIFRKRASRLLYRLQQDCCGSSEGETIAEGERPRFPEPLSACAECPPTGRPPYLRQPQQDCARFGRHLGPSFHDPEFLRRYACDQHLSSTFILPKAAV